MADFSNIDVEKLVVAWEEEFCYEDLLDKTLDKTKKWFWSTSVLTRRAEKGRSK
jgi:hypothetical protein